MLDLECNPQQKVHDEKKHAQSIARFDAGCVGATTAEEAVLYGRR